MFIFKVNEQKMLDDHKALETKKVFKLQEIEAQVRSFALQLGYDEEKTRGLVEYVQNQNGNGLSAEESAKLEFLSSYIDKVEDSVDEVAEGEVVKCNIVPTIDDGEVASTTFSTTTNI